MEVGVNGGRGENIVSHGRRATACKCDIETMWVGDLHSLIEKHKHTHFVNSQVLMLVMVDLDSLWRLEKKQLPSPSRKLCAEFSRGANSIWSQVAMWGIQLLNYKATVMNDTTMNY